MKLNQVNPGTPNEPSYATLYTDYDLQQTDASTKAYYITTVTEGSAKLTLTSNEGRDIPKRTAVVLINSEGNVQTAFTIVSTLSSVVSEGDNKLKGTLMGIALDLTDNTPYYSLGRWRADSSSPYVVGFYKTGATITLGANRAYLDLTGVQTSASGYVFSFDDEQTTSVSEELGVRSEEYVPARGWYTLDGRKLSGQPATKGLYIYNGKKILLP